MSKSKAIKKRSRGRPPSNNPAAKFIQLRATAERKAAYMRAARPGKLTEWCFIHLDAAAGFNGER